MREKNLQGAWFQRLGRLEGSLRREEAERCEEMLLSELRYYDKELYKASKLHHIVDRFISFWIFQLMRQTRTLFIRLIQSPHSYE